MKRILLAIMVSVALLPSVAKAQTVSFTTAADTVWMDVITSADSNDEITNLTTDTLTLKWEVIAAPTFPPGWYADTALSICDNASCRNNSGGFLWNGTSGHMITSHYYPSATGAFGFFPSLGGCSVGGTRAITINIADSTRGTAGYGYSKHVVFVVTHPGSTLSAPNTIAGTTDNSVNLYPNPAKDELNVVYSPAADVKTITVYSIIGKIMGVYKVTDTEGANLNISNMPAGIYFVRLTNSNGEAVVTRKFTKQ